jgi:ribosomal-protein-alanine N-acetyltransferase
MIEQFHDASTAEVTALWPLVNPLRLFDSLDGLLASRVEAPWKVRIDGAGNAAVLDVWREHLRILQMRAAWCQARRFPDLLADVREVARSHGFSSVLSPIAEEAVLRPYIEAGMQATERLVVLRARPAGMASVSAPANVTIRDAEQGDAAAIAGVEEACFDEFWRRGPRDIETRFGRDRTAVATCGDEVIGYTLTTVGRGAGSLGSLGVHPSFRRRGIGRALLSDACAYLASAGAQSVTLCTQEHNAASRALYSTAGFSELPSRLALACGSSAQV